MKKQLEAGEQKEASVISVWSLTGYYIPSCIVMHTVSQLNGDHSYRSCNLTDGASNGASSTLLAVLRCVVLLLIGSLAVGSVPCTQIAETYLQELSASCIHEALFIR